jgi:hypothetical protein
VNTGIKTYVNLNINKRIFGAMIVADVDSTQYWRDRPLYLKNVKNWFSDAINWSAGNYSDYLETSSVTEYLDSMKKIQSGVDVYQNTAERIKDTIERYSKVNANTPNVDYPTNPVDSQDINIYDADGNIVDTIVTDTNARETKQTPTGDKTITVLDGLPDNYTDDISPEALDQATITTLPDSFIKEKLWIGQEYIPNLAIEMTDATNSIIDPISATGSITSDTQPNLESFNAGIRTPTRIFYGIPLIDLSPKGTAIKDAVIVHINTKKGRRLDITNISTSGLETSSITIDKIIPPGVKFTAGVAIEYNSITLFLKVDGDPEFYSTRVPLTEEMSLTISGFGTDPENLKSLCGHIYDIRQFETLSNFNKDPNIKVPLIPSGAISYPNSSGLVRGENTYSTRNGEVSARNGGLWWEMNTNWKAVYNGYLDRFFCRHDFTRTDFTITWFQYQLGYPAGIRTIISDNVNNNYIQYDYSTFELTVDFGGLKQTRKLIMPEFMWVQFSIKYNSTTNILTVIFRETDQDREYSYDFQLGDFIFQLRTLWARFSNEEKRYVEVQRGAFTLLNLYKEDVSLQELDDLYQKNKTFLMDFNLNDVPEAELP